MKKFLLSVYSILLTTICMNATNDAFDITTPGVNYLKTTNAPLTGNSAFTIEFWFNNNGNAIPSYGRLIGFDGFASDISVDGGTIKVYDGNWRTTTATGLSNGWHHVAVTNNLTNMFVYVDGIQVYTKASATYNFTNAKMYLGISNALSATDRISAYMDEVRVWNIARSLVQINADRTKQLVGNETNLVAYYPALKGALNDVSSSANNLIKVGTVPTKVFKFGAYIHDYAIDFDGNDDRLEVATPLTGTTDFTLEAQFKTTNANASVYGRIFAWTGNAFEVAVKSGVIYTYATSWAATTSANLNNGQWHHVAVTKSANVVTIYVDEVQVGQRTVATVTLAGTMHIGNRYGTTLLADAFTGQIDEVRVWNNIFPYQDIQNRMDSTLTGSELNLVAYYDMNTPSTNVTNLVSAGAPLNRSGASGTNNLPPFVSIPLKTVSPSILSSTTAFGCGTGSVTISAASTSGIINWFAAATGGASIGTGTNFTTPSISTTTTYYAEAVKNSVASATRTAVIATVNPMPLLTVSVTGLSLTANETGATYQWINCTGNTAINGATNQSYTATVNGSYAVIVGKNGCSDTSACTNITSVGINSYSQAVKTVTIYPNPASKLVTISTTGKENCIIDLIDYTGKIIHSTIIVNDNTIFDINEYANGIYFIRVANDDGVSIHKLIINK